MADQPTLEMVLEFTVPEVLHRAIMGNEDLRQAVMSAAIQAAVGKLVELTGSPDLRVRTLGPVPPGRN